MSFIIYKHTLKIGEHAGWSYIGQTCQKTGKRGQNGNGYLDNHCGYFAAAIKKHGGDSFSHEIIEDNIKTQAEANEREIYGISFYHTYVNDPECRGYNLTTGGNSYNSKKVICLETGKIYQSISEAAIQTNVGVEQISYQLHDHINTTTNRTVRKLHGAYYTEDFDLEQEKQKGYILKCLDTDEYFMSIKEASEKYNISSNSIIHCLKGDYETAGNHYGKGAKDLTEEEKKDVSYKYKEKAFICLETQEVFYKLKDATLKYKGYHIKECLENRRKSTKGLHGKYLNNELVNE